MLKQILNKKHVNPFFKYSIKYSIILFAMILIILTSMFIKPINSQAAGFPKTMYYWQNFSLRDYNQDFSLMRANGYNQVYFNMEFFLNPYLDKQNTFNILTNFAKAAAANKVSIVGLMGNRDWANNDKNEIIYRALEFIKEYNAQSYYVNSIRGLHLNIEFYLQSGFLANKNFFTQQYVSFFDDLAFEIKNYQKIDPDFELSATLPHFSDTTDFIPSITYCGGIAPLFTHVARTFNNLPNSVLTIMAYRNTITGPNSVYDLIEEELVEADKLFPQLKIGVALETVPEESFVTFYGRSKVELESAIVALHNKLNGGRNYRNIVVHDIVGYTALK